MKTIIIFKLFILTTFFVFSQEQNKHVRTPKDYLFIADGAYDRQKDNEKGEIILNRPKYLRQLTHDELPILDENGFYEDGLTGYAGAVFEDTRDGTIIISHRGTESIVLKGMIPFNMLEFELPDPRDAIADVQIVTQTLTDRITPEIYKQFIDGNFQYHAAKKLIQAVVDKYSDTCIIEQTGHSLGGSLTQRLAYEYGTKGITFDPAGVGSSDCFDVSKKDNAKKITNYKIHNSIVSSHITTGENIGTTIEIYPTEDAKIKGTSAHGLFNIYSYAINHETGYFKTGEETITEVAMIHWNKNEKIFQKIKGDYNYNDRVVKKISVQEKFNGDFDKFKEYLIKANNIQTEPVYNSSIKNSVQFCPITSNSNEGGHTIRSTGNFILFDNMIEKGIYETLEHQGRWYIVINKIDYPRINSDFWFNEFQNKVGEFKFQNPMPEVRSMDDIIGNDINESARGYQNE